MKKHEFDYYVMKESNYYAVNSNINFYKVEFYNQENKKLNINFVVIHIIMIQCHNCCQIFNIKNVLFHHLHSESFKITHCCNKKKSKLHHHWQLCWQSLWKNCQKLCWQVLSLKILKQIMTFKIDITLWLKHIFLTRLHQNLYIWILNVQLSYLTESFSRVRAWKWKFTLWLHSYQYE